MPASAFTNAELGQGSDVFEWGTQAFSKIACARPVYLNVSHVDVTLIATGVLRNYHGNPAINESAWPIGWPHACSYLKPARVYMLPLVYLCRN